MKPTIKIAKETAKKMDARQVVICAFDFNGRMAVVSYGVTKTECQDVKPLCDGIADAIMAGSLPTPGVNR